MCALHINSVLVYLRCGKDFGFTTPVSVITDMTTSKACFIVGALLLVLEEASAPLFAKKILCDILT